MKEEKVITKDITLEQDDLEAVAVRCVILIIHALLGSL